MRLKLSVRLRNITNTRLYLLIMECFICKKRSRNRKTESKERGHTIKSTTEKKMIRQEQGHHKTTTTKNNANLTFPKKICLSKTKFLILIYYSDVVENYYNIPYLK